MSKKLFGALKWSVVYVSSYMMSMIMLVVALFCWYFAFNPVPDSQGNFVETIVFMSGCILSLYLCYRFGKIHFRMWRISRFIQNKKWRSLIS